MLNYIGFTIAQLRILRLQKHKSGWGFRYPGHGIFTPTVYCRLLDKQNRQLSDLLDPHPVFLTDCAISYQAPLENANI